MHENFSCTGQTEGVEVGVTPQLGLIECNIVPLMTDMGDVKLCSIVVWLSTH
jgi:hypothetical protein